MSDAIRIAKEKSFESKKAFNNLEISNNKYLINRVQFLPQISLNANLPGYYNNITSVTQPDGSIQFTSVEQAYSNLGLNLTQKIPLTGGVFTASSNLNRFDRLSGNRSTNFNSSPFILGLNQPIFKFNETKYSIQIAEMNKKIGAKEFIQKQEELALQVCLLFFEVLQSQMNLEVLKFTQLKTDSLLIQAKNKVQLGKITYSEVLNAQNQLLQTKETYLQTIASYWKSYYQLRALLLFDIHTFNQL